MNRQKSRTDKFLLNVVMSTVVQIITIITGLITPRLMLKYYGSEINGLTTSIMQYLSYIGLVEAGLGNAVAFALYRPLANNDTEGRNAVISAARIAYRNTGLVFTGLALVLALGYPLIVHTDLLNYTQIAALVLVLCMNSVLNFFVMAKYRALLTADQCSYCISFVTAVQYILHTLVIVITVRLFNSHVSDVIVVRGLAVLTVFISALLLSVIVRRNYRNLDFHAKPDKSALVKRNDAMFIQILGVIQNGAPVIIMTSMLGLATVSVYSVYNMVAGTMSTCIDVFTSGLAAGFGNINATGDREKLKETNEQFRVLIFSVIAVLYASMLTLIIPFVRLYTRGISDAEYILPGFALFITLFGLFNSVYAPYGMLVYSLGKYREILPYTAVRTVIAVVGSLIGSRLWGLTGVAAALSLSALYMLCVYMFFTPRHLIAISVPKELSRILRAFVTVFAVFGLSLVAGYQPDSYLAWVLYALAVVAVSTSITFLHGFLFDRRVWHRIFARARIYIGQKLRRGA